MDGRVVSPPRAVVDLLWQRYDLLKPERLQGARLMVSGILDPFSIPEGLWRRDGVRAALDRRDIADLFRLVRQHTGASQTRIGIATGLSQGTVCLIMKGSRLVSAIDVLERIADGLAMPDEARVRLGLAPRASTLCSARRDSAAEEKGFTRTTANSSVGAGMLDHELRKLEAALAEAYAAVRAQWAVTPLTTIPGLGQTRSSVPTG